jgi:hypothetical protein
MAEYDVVTDQISRWELHTLSRPLIKCLDRVLRAMDIGAIYELRTSKLQVVVLPRGLTWAYFPIHECRVVTDQFTLQPGTKVLLTISERIHTQKQTCDDLAHHFGHVLCYLRKPGWIHDCVDADRAARQFGLKALLHKTN